MNIFHRLCFAFLLVVQCRSQCLQESGPYTIKFLMFDECLNTGDHEMVFSPVISRDYANCSVDKLSCSLKITLQMELNDEYETQTTMYCLDSIRLWKPVRKFKAIKTCTDFSIWIDIIKIRRYSAERCLIPKGTYSFSCVEYARLIVGSWSAKSVHQGNVTFYGQYKTVHTYFRNGRMVGCIYVVFRTQPTDAKPLLV